MTDDAPDTQTDAPPAASPKASLKDRIRRARESRVLDHDVPGLGGIFVRFRPLDSDEITDIWDRSTDTSAIRRHASAVTTACVGIFDRHGDGAVSLGDTFDGRIDADGALHGTAVRFQDAEVADMVGIDRDRPVADRVLELFVTEGDVAAASDAIIDLSGFTTGGGRPNG